MTLLEKLVSMAILALAISAVSMTITKSYVFKSLRVRIRARSDFWGEFVECPYCWNHWFALAVELVYRIIPVSCGIVWIDYTVAIFALVALSSFSCGLIFRSFRVGSE